MLTAFFAACSRHRHPLLAASFVLAVGLLAMPTVSSFFPPTVGLVLAGLGLVAATLGLASVFVARPPGFILDPRTPALRTLPHAVYVLFGVGLVLEVASQAGRSVWLAVTSQGDPSMGPVLWVNYVLAGVGVAISVAYVVSIWRGFGVRLGPHALVDQNPFGRLTVPWEALAPGYPELVPPSPKGALILRYTRPELVDRRGLVPNRYRISAYGTDPRFVGCAIAYYVDHPEERSTIGTREGYERLLRALGISVTGVRH